MIKNIRLYLVCQKLNEITFDKISKKNKCLDSFSNGSRAKLNQFLPTTVNPFSPSKAAATAAARKRQRKKRLKHAKGLLTEPVGGG